MEKYIYAVRKGRRSGIYADWKDYYEQISELSDAESQKFMYQEELEEEDEEFPYSKAWAIRKAEQYIQQTKYVDMSEILHQKLWINDELRMGSPWLDAILSIAGRGTPQISGG
ncbi:MAG: viroplasmin family protein, partial [Erysipelotrichaceae bacterium]|nr:viroplasmin family protein [Erysipelotrichaceae bacterium]